MWTGWGDESVGRARVRPQVRAQDVAQCSHIWMIALGFVPGTSWCPAYHQEWPLSTAPHQSHQKKKDSCSEQCLDQRQRERGPRPAPTLHPLPCSRSQPATSGRALPSQGHVLSFPSWFLSVCSQSWHSGSSVQLKVTCAHFQRCRRRRFTQCTVGTRSVGSRQGEVCMLGFTPAPSSPHSPLHTSSLPP